MFFFCFKPKTAYEMRIRYWSSDVCSSDLRCVGRCGGERHHHRLLAAPEEIDGRHAAEEAHRQRIDHDHVQAERKQHDAHIGAQAADQLPAEKCGEIEHEAGDRSEEYTYELQSLMRISYAVLCLKKKN